MYISRANEHSMINSGICVPPPELPLPNNIAGEFEFQCVLQILNCQSFSIMEIITRRTPGEHLNFAGGILFSDKRTSRRINITISQCSGFRAWPFRHPAESSANSVRSTRLIVRTMVATATNFNSTMSLIETTVSIALQNCAGLFQQCIFSLASPFDFKSLEKYQFHYILMT